VLLRFGPVSVPTHRYHGTHPERTVTLLDLSASRSTSLLPTTAMDYEGQKLSELLFHILILTFGGVGWVAGYFAQNFTYVFYAWAIGTALSVVVSFGERGFGGAVVLCVVCGSARLYFRFLLLLLWRKQCEQCCADSMKLKLL